MSEHQEQESFRHHRWTDDMLEEFRNEFRAHVKKEDADQQQQQAMFDALFKREEDSLDGQPGLLQLMRQMHKQMKDMQIWQDRQKTFVGGIVFVIGSLGFLFTEQAARIATGLKRIFS